MTARILFGAPTTHSSLVCQFAIEKGWFDEAGLDVSVETVHGGPELAQAYHSGAIPLGEMGSPPAITAISKGADFRIIGSSMRRGVALFLAMAPGLNSVADLRGKTLGALSHGSCSDWYLREILLQAGLDPERHVTIRSLGQDHKRVLELFASGEISAALLSGLNSMMGEAQGVSRHMGSVFELADVPHLQWSVYVANRAFLEKSPEQARAVFDVLTRAGHHIASHQDEWVAFTARRFDVDTALAQRVYQLEAPYLHFAGELDLDGLSQAVSIQHRLNAITRQTPLPSLVATSFIESLGQAQPSVRN